MAAVEVDSSEDAAVVMMFASARCAVCCSGCSGRMPIRNPAVINFFTSRNNDLDIVCGDCGTITCLGCGDAVTPATKKFGIVTASKQHFTWHCNNGLFALIWALLCGYDDQSKHNKRRNDSTTEASRKKPTQYSGIGYGTNRDHVDLQSILEATTKLLSGGGDHSHGKDASSALMDLWKAVGGHPFDDPIESTAAPRTLGRPDSPSIKTRVDPDDEPTIKIMEALNALLPSATGQQIPTDFDYALQPTLAALLRCSSVFDKAAELLLNTSLDDAMKRERLYNSLCDFIRALATAGPPTAFLLTRARSLNKCGHDLLKVSYAQPTRVKGENVETARSLSLCAQNLINQSNLLLNSAKMHPNEYMSLESQKMVILCKNITDCGGILKSIDQDNNHIPNTPQDAYAWQDSLMVLAVPDEQILDQYYYAGEARAIIDPPFGRMRQLIRDIHILQDAKLPNIFIRYGETRLDIMKVLIIGPKDTPYENGAFEFDLLLPPDYPNKPPKMHLRTVGGGVVGFNPNLYPNGKVCLSILGTWPSKSKEEEWQPGHSTVFQVVASVQSMILCEDPFSNEPGREYMQGSDLSRKYNAGLRVQVVKYAMLEWIEREKAPKPHIAEETSSSLSNYGSSHTPDQLPQLTSSAKKAVAPVPAAPDHESPPKPAMSFAPHQQPQGTSGMFDLPPSLIDLFKAPESPQHQTTKIKFSSTNVSAAPNEAHESESVLKTSSYLPKSRAPSKPRLMSIFQEVAKKHFEINERDIINTVKVWIKEAKALEAEIGRKRRRSGKEMPTRSHDTSDQTKKKIDELKADYTLEEFLKTAEQDLDVVGAAWFRMWG